jgi:hypothetical protein
LWGNNYSGIKTTFLRTLLQNIVIST